MYAGRYEEALVALKEALTRNPNFLPAHLDLAVSYSELGREEEAQAEVAEAIRINASRRSIQQFFTRDPADVEPLSAARKAGLK